MKRGTFAILPFLAAVGVYAFLSSTEPTYATYWGIGLLARALAGIGCFVAASQFDRGDYMRRAWILLGTPYALAFTNAILFGSPSNAQIRDISTAAAITSGVIIFLANASIIAGALLVARAWKAANLDLLVKPRTRWAVTATSVVIGVVVAGPAGVAQFQALLGGNMDALTRVASVIGDMVTLAVLGPILLTALALRGGSLAWPWSMLVVGVLGWLLYDGVLSVISVFGYDRSGVRLFEEGLRMFACTSFFSAGILQAMAVGVRAPADAAAPSAAAPPAL